MTPPPLQPPPPTGPRRRPYGSVRLSAPITLAPSLPRPEVDTRRWYGRRITLPPLSLGTLRHPEPPSWRDA
ncbi:hypothetical protein [Streptomyces sp. CT34]|uniref:hypothetical protein n=1 Tax=Streptomyces sp. CT34 TaxID=1553907 RepID=UPI0005B87871|nr:hypothetical protein [Streptomyces sp. CT34]